MVLSLAGLGVHLHQVSLQGHLLARAQVGHRLLLRNLRLVLLFLLLPVAEAHVLDSHCASLHDSCAFVESRQLVDPLDLTFDLSCKLPLELLLVLLLLFLLLYLRVVVRPHLLPLLHDLGAAFLVLNVICDDILESQHVPRVVLFRLDMARLTLLEGCLGIVELLVGRRLVRARPSEGGVRMHLLMIDGRDRWPSFQRWR